MEHSVIRNLFLNTVLENIKSFNEYSKKALDTLEKQMIIVSAALPAELAATGYMELMEAILGFMASITDLTQKALVDNLSDEENKLSTYKSEILDILSSSLGLVGRFIDEKDIALNTSRKLYSSLEKNSADNAKDAVSDAASEINKRNVKKEFQELAQKVVEESEKEKAKESEGEKAKESETTKKFESNDDIDKITLNKIINIVNQIKANNGSPPKGYKGGKKYKNEPKEGDQKLPECNNYKEYDINPRIKGKNRGCERIIIENDDSVWYINNHYHTFIQIK